MEEKEQCSKEGRIVWSKAQTGNRVTLVRREYKDKQEGIHR